MLVFKEIDYPDMVVKFLTKTEIPIHRVKEKLRLIILCIFVKIVNFRNFISWLRLQQLLKKFSNN